MQAAVNCFWRASIWRQNAQESWVIPNAKHLIVLLLESLFQCLYSLFDGSLEGVKVIPGDEPARALLYATTVNG